MKKKNNMTTNAIEILYIALIVFSVLVFSILEKVNAQTTFGQYSIPISVQGGDSIGQSFLFPGGNLKEISLPVFSRYLITDHPATLYIRSGNTPYGAILFQSSILVPSLHKWYPPNLLDTASLNTMDGVFWMAIQDSINSGSFDFYDLATSYNVDEVFPSGVMTVVIALDTNLRNPMAWDNFITGFTNCYTPSLCNVTSPYGPLQSNVYQNGNIFWGGTNFPLSFNFSPFISDADLAFEVTYTSIGTGVEEIGDVQLVQNNGTINIPEKWIGCTLYISDLLGRTKKVMNLSESIVLESHQIVFLTFIDKKGKSFTKKLWVN